ncbi:MAG: DUF928 domain-containing protein [Cyanobacteria bacterium J06626_14]
MAILNHRINRRTSKLWLTRCTTLVGMTVSWIVVGPLMASVAVAEAQITEELAMPLENLSDGTTNNQPLVFNASTDGFDGQGRPASRSSGGSRGDCQTQLIALVPGEGTLSDDCSQPTDSLTALTTLSQPTLWFYIPEDDSTLQAELALLDDNQHAIFIATPSIPVGNGIVGVHLDYELEENQTYRWVFSVLQNTSPSRILTVEGTVRHVMPDAELQQQLDASSNSRDRIVQLAQAGIWHDALTELVMLRQQQPNETSVMEDWQQFLDSVGLGSIADAPILE